MGILSRAKRILKSHVHAALDDVKLAHAGDYFDPMSEEAATMDDEAWYRAAKARQEGQRRQKQDPSAVAPPDELSRAYANLDCPAGADLRTVREAWRRKMLKYHPDKFPHDSKKRDAATKLTALLNESFQKLEAHLKRRGAGH